MRVFYNNEIVSFNSEISESWLGDIYSVIKEWPDTDEYVIKTSGSTGAPKEIRLLKSEMIASARNTIEYFNLQKSDRALLCLPSQYIAGKMMIVRSLLADLDLCVIEPSANPLKELDSPIDFVALTPMQLSLAYEHCPERISLCRMILLGGGPIDQNLQDKIDNTDSRTQFYHSYGMTETITHVAIRPLSGPDKSDSYRAMPGVKFSQDEYNRLIINADYLSQSPFYTNDIVNLIDDQQFIWLSRFDNVINSGGIKIFPQQIENKISKEMTKRFFVAGENDHILGSKVVLVIESDKDDLGLEKLRTMIKRNLTKFEQPKMIYFVPELKETPTGKIKRDLSLYDLRKGINISHFDLL